MPVFFANQKPSLLYVKMDTFRISKGFPFDSQTLCLLSYIRQAVLSEGRGRGLCQQLVTSPATTHHVKIPTPLIGGHFNMFNKIPCIIFVGVRFSYLNVRDTTRRIGRSNLTG